MTARKVWPRVLCLLVCLPFSASLAATAVQPARQQGKVCLFDAARDDPAVFRHYTASWRKGSDFTPVAKPVEKGGRRFLEVRYTGSRGMACSTVFFEALPPPDPGKRYAGLRLLIDCDRDDYPRISVQAKFSDDTQLSKNLVMDRGLHSYTVSAGFRRAKFPPKWGLLRYIMVTANAGDNPAEMTYRLARIEMVEYDAPKSHAAQPAKPFFGRPILLPQPKTCSWSGKGFFAAGKARALHLGRNASARTARTAEVFADTYHGYTGVRLPVATFGDALPKEGVVLRVAPSVQMPGGPEPLKKEGYCLVVEPGSVVITGADEPGLYYGTVTFFQLLRSPMKTTRRMQVPCVRIFDWPDTPNRLVRLEHPHHFKNGPLGDNRGMAYLMDWADRFVAGTKSNVLFIDFAALIRYKRRPEFNGTERIYSLDGLRQFGQFCRDRFIDLCPAWQVGCHASWWLTVGYHPELREKGWSSQADVTHPDHDPIVLDCMLDVIEALKPKYLSPKSDEWWHKRKDGETPNELLHGKTRAQAFLDFHVKLNRWLKARGIRMMIYHDMLTPYHNARRFGLYKIIDQFPKDVIINLWSNGDPERNTAWFADRGFTVWTNATGFFTLTPDLEARVGGIGKGLYSFGNDRSGLLDEDSNLHSMAYVLRTADYAWTRARRGPWDTDRLTAVRHMLATGPNPHGGEKIEPFEIAADLTHSFGAMLKNVKPAVYGDADSPITLPAGMQEIGLVPMRLAGRAAKDCVVLGKDDGPVELHVAGRWASLIFLHTGFVNNPDDPAIAGGRKRKWLYGWPCGEYVVHYADGEKTVLPVRLTMNVKRFDTATLNRATNENRFVHTLKDCRGGDVHLYQWEWVNPRPDRRIVKVLARHDGQLDVSLVLFAVSGRHLRQR
jgi:hypothetical protein